MSKGRFEFRRIVDCDNCASCGITTHWEEKVQLEYGETWNDFVANSLHERRQIVATQYSHCDDCGMKLNTGNSGWFMGVYGQHDWDAGLPEWGFGH